MRQEVCETTHELGEERLERDEKRQKSRQAEAKRLQFLLGNFSIKFVTLLVSRTQGALSQGEQRQGDEGSNSTSRIQHCAGNIGEKKFVQETGLSPQHAKILKMLPGVSFA